MSRKVLAYNKAQAAIKLAKKRVLEDIKQIQAAEAFVKKAEGEFGDHFDNDHEAGIDTNENEGKGYCINCDEIVDQTPEGDCPICNEPTDDIEDID